MLAVNRGLGGSLERLSGTNLNEAGAALARQRLRGLAAAPKGSSVVVVLRRSAGVVDIGLVSSPERGARLKLSRPLLRLRTTGGAVSISWR